MRRAKEHIDAFDVSTRHWANANRVTLRRKSNINFTEHRWVASIPPAPYERWGILAGDALASLRNALDHAVYGAAVFLTGENSPPKGDKIAFPICDSPKNFKGTAWRFEAFDEVDEVDVRALAERLQPYHDGSGKIRPIEEARVQTLSLLRNLSNADKHRVVHQISLTYPKTSASFSGYRGTISEWTWKIGPAEDGAEATSAKTSIASSNVKVEFKEPFVIALLNLPQEAAEVLTSFHDVVSDTVQEFAADIPW